MIDRYEVEGRLEGNRLIRLNEPIPCNEGPVRVIVKPLVEGADLGQQNRAALEALNQLLQEHEDLTPKQWDELEKVIQDHPLRIRKGSSE
jgi:hypothetical protein